MTDPVRNAFDQCGTKLLVIPGGCTSVLQPLDISINKPLKSYIRHSWCQYMLDETEKGVAKVKCPPKEAVIEWILRAQQKIEEKNIIVKKSFLVAGITNTIGRSEEELIRDDPTYREIQQIMVEVFREVHMGYVEPAPIVDEDPFANCTLDSEGTDLDEPDSEGTDLDEPAEEQMSLDSS